MSEKPDLDDATVAKYYCQGGMDLNDFQKKCFIKLVKKEKHLPVILFLAYIFISFFNQKTQIYFRFPSLVRNI